MRLKLIMTSQITNVPYVYNKNVESIEGKKNTVVNNDSLMNRIQSNAYAIGSTVQLIEKPTKQAWSHPKLSPKAEKFAMRYRLTLEASKIGGKNLKLLRKTEDFSPIDQYLMEANESSFKFAHVLKSICLDPANPKDQIARVIKNCLNNLICTENFIDLIAQTQKDERDINLSILEYRAILIPTLESLQTNMTIKNISPSEIRDTVIMLLKKTQSIINILSPTTIKSFSNANALKEVLFATRTNLAKMAEIDRETLAKVLEDVGHYYPEDLGGGMMI